MSKKIYGIPVTTPYNPKKIKEDVVKTVNGVAPDENGNVEIKAPDSSGNATIEGETLVLSDSSTATIEEETLIL